MRISKMTVGRSAKVNTGNYENTDIHVVLEATLDPTDDATVSYHMLMANADALLKHKVDEIELGVAKVKSKAGRFGV